MLQHPETTAPAPGLPACSVKTRIGPSAVFGKTHTEPLPFVSHEAHRTSTVSWPEAASDLRLYSQPDPKGTGSPQLRRAGVIPLQLEPPFGYASLNPTRFVDRLGLQAETAEQALCVIRYTLLGSTFGATAGGLAGGFFGGAGGSFALPGGGTVVGAAGGAAVGSAVGAGVLGGAGYLFGYLACGCANEATDRERERCLKRKWECHEECVGQVGRPGGNYFLCMNECLAAAGCGNYWK